MSKTLKVVLAALPLSLSACSANTKSEFYVCPKCGTQMVLKGQTQTVEPSVVAPAAPSPVSAAAPGVAAAPAPVAAAPVAPYSGQPVTSANATSSRIYRIAAKNMVGVVEQAVVKAPLNLKVESSANGVIMTSYKEGYEGDFHIARRWQERTRFRIVVIPDVMDPVNACRIEVADESQERSNERAGWQTKESTRRPERSQEVIQAIEANVPR
jgi:hypothetical protein